MRIGMFDSGIGGLTVLKSFIKDHPNNEYIYYGDTLHVPYGDKTIDELYKRVSVIIDFLKKKNVDIIIIACGTVSSNLYERLKEEVNIPIYSVISEIPKYIEEKNYSNILVMATSRTIDSHVFRNRIKSNVIEMACPKLVPAIESGKDSEIDAILDEYLKNINNIDSLILGCTHFPLVKEKIKSKVGDAVDIIDMGEVLSKNIDIKDTKYSLELYFSKVDDIINENIKKILS